MKKIQTLLKFLTKPPKELFGFCKFTGITAKYTKRKLPCMSDDIEGHISCKDCVFSDNYTQSKTLIKFIQIESENENDSRT